MTTEKNITPFIIQGTADTPAISFIPNNLYFNISGIATSLQTAELFFNAGKWIAEYDKSFDLRSPENKDKPLNLTFEFNLLNAEDNSLEALKGLFQKLEQMNRMNHRKVYVIIKWHYYRCSASENMNYFLSQYIDGYRIFFETINEMSVPSFFMHPTNISPKIFFDTPNHMFLISGSSRPEHPDAFYDKVMQWVEHNGRQWMCGYPLVFKLCYFNTSSGKRIMELLKYVNKWYSIENRGTIYWYYVDEDEIEEIKDEFEANVQYLTFNYILEPINKLLGF